MALMVSRTGNLEQEKEMTNKLSLWLDEPESPCEQCEDCPHPNGCIRECIIANYKEEDVAEIRGEKE